VSTVYSWYFSGDPHHKGHMNKALDRVIERVESDMHILVPFVTVNFVETLIKRLQSRATEAGRAELLLRIVICADPMPFAGVREREKLVTLLTSAHPKVNIQAAVGLNLHAKVYLADDTIALVTSGNLTGGGMNTNAEAGILVEDRNLCKAIREDADRYFPASRLTFDSLEAARLQTEQGPGKYYVVHLLGGGIAPQPPSTMPVNAGAATPRRRVQVVRSTRPERNLDVAYERHRTAILLILGRQQEITRQRLQVLIQQEFAGAMIRGAVTAEEWVDNLLQEGLIGGHPVLTITPKGLQCRRGHWPPTN
jgi:hypothetical protein